MSADPLVEAYRWLDSCRAFVKICEEQLRLAKVSLAKAEERVKEIGEQFETKRG